MGLAKFSKRSTSASSTGSNGNAAPRPAILTMGISPAAAVATWRLAESQMFDCYTYWPVQDITFQSEVFGKDQTFRANHFDLNEPPRLLPGQTIAAVFLVVPTIKDVSRMCKKLKPVLSNSSLVFVDISGGFAPVQRLVKGNLGSSIQVSGLISDIDAEFLSRESGHWQILHRSASTVPAAATTASQSLITLEPCNPQLKTIISLEEAWANAGLSSTHLKSSAMFGEFQWNRCITTVVFELLTVLLDSPDPASISQSVVAKPLVEGLIAELMMVAAACGTNSGLPSKSQMMSLGAKLARRAPADFGEPSFSRTYYKVYRKLPVSLDFLVLLPILLSDELPKGGLTPYLECVYAFLSRILQLNGGEYESYLFMRNIGDSGAKHAEVDPQVLADLESRERQLADRENQLATFDQMRTTEIQQQRDELQQSQQLIADERAGYLAQVDELQALIQQLKHQNQNGEQQQQQLEQQIRQLQSQQQQQQSSEVSEQLEILRSREQEMVQREAGLRQQFEKQQQQIEQQQQQLQQQQQRSAGADAGLNDQLERLRLREQELSEREERLKRDQLIMQQQQLQQQRQQQQLQEQQHTPTQGTAITSPTSPSVTAQPPTTPGGTTYSRFDPRAPPTTQQLPQQYQSTDSAESYAAADTSLNSVDSRGSSARASVSHMYYPGGVPHAGRVQSMMPPGAAAQPVFQSGGSYVQPNYAMQQPQQFVMAQAPPQGLSQGQSMPVQPTQQGQPMPQSQQYRRRASRRASVGDDSDLLSIGSGRRRQQSIPASQSALFSQNFHLDGVMNSTTDRYHFVSRGRTKQRDPKLSSDEDAYHKSRKYIHGGGASGNYPNLSNGSGIPETTPAGSGRRKSSYNGGISHSASIPLATRQTPSVGVKNSVSSPNMPQSLIPSTVVPSGQANDLASGFNFGGGSNESIDPLDASHQMPASLDPASRGDAYGSFPGSNNSSSMESNQASDRSDTRTPPTPQGSIDPLRQNNSKQIQEEGDKGKSWGKRLFRMN